MRAVCIVRDPGAEAAAKGSHLATRREALARLAAPRFAPLNIETRSGVACTNKNHRLIG